MVENTTMAEASISDEDSGPSTRPFSPPSAAPSSPDGGFVFKPISPDADNSVPSTSVSDEIEQQISESLDQLSTSNNENSGQDSDDEVLVKDLRRKKLTPQRNGNNDVNNGDEDDQDDDDDDEEEEHYRKRVRVGNHYQARIPRWYGEGAAAPDEDPDDRLLWDPFDMSSEAVEDFLRRFSSLTKLMIPMGSHLRDDEHALYLLQQSDHDIEATLGQLRTPGSKNNGIVNNSDMWSEEECKNFESGLVRFGKNFFSIQKKRLTTRRVSELVQFYYLWKKTERYDLLAHRIRAGKKKYVLNPGISDLMVKYFNKGTDKVNFGNSDVQLILNNDKKDIAQSDVQY